MLTTDIFIAITSLCITCFALGYAVGSKSNDKTQKNRPCLTNFGGFFITNKYQANRLSVALLYVYCIIIPLSCQTYILF